jgi:membrane-bound lytic murein transglycosylase A
MYGALYDICGRAAALPTPDIKAARAFFEQNFRPVRIAPAGEADGFITGYYEPVVDGRRQPDNTFAYPLYRKPDNLLPGGRMLGPAKVVTKKVKGRRVSRRQLVPFFDRARIEDGVLAGRNLEICYLKDPVDAFFVHIQGSVRVKLDDGHMLRLNYVAANGHPYTAVGKYLIERNIVTREDMSMEKIRQWMNANPEDGQQLRLRNKSYVFFRETGLADNEEPTGAQGVSLTPGRSIAVDRRLHVYGTPFFLQAELPIDSEAPATRFRRLMIAQDTGGAIVGPARADIYWGVGVEAGVISGRFKQPGKFVVLIPNAIDPFATKDKDEVPLPRPRPAIGAVAATTDKPIVQTKVAAHPVAKKPTSPKKAEPPSLLTKIFTPKTTANKSAKLKKTRTKKLEPKKAAVKKNEPKKAEPKQPVLKKPSASKLQRKT